MNSYYQTIKSVTLAYFSGTGGTKLVTDYFEKGLLKRKIPVKKLDIATHKTYQSKATDLLIVLSPVYAFGLSFVVEHWVKELPLAKGSYAAVISVSGGGEISPNTACRMTSKKYLKKKNYDVIYEKMLVMPSNFAMQAKRELNLELIHILPQKVDKIITDLMHGKKNLLQPKVQDRLFAFLGKAEHFGAGFFALSLYATKDCNQCGLCIKHCPKKNIRMKNQKPKFGMHCLWCMKCIYACPRHAIKSRIFPFVILKEGFSIKKMCKEASQTLPMQRSTLHSGTKNPLWQGVINYLKEK